MKLSPVKIKAKSEDKAFQLFNNSKNYVEQISMENSMILSRVSEVTDSRSKGFSTNREVKFR
jgi:NADPH-dependent curcumin reductase CurA